MKKKLLHVNANDMVPEVLKLGKQESNAQESNC
jgi:hypothetical protein